MQPKLIKYYLLGLFIIGLALFIVLQFNSAQNIRQLISGNEKLLDELNVKNELQQLQTNIAKTDSKVRGTIISQDTLNITGIEAEVAIIRGDLAEINKLVLNDSTQKLLTQLNYLVNEKNNFNIAVLDSFYGKGKWSAERMLNAQKGKRLGEAINVVLHALDSTRQTEVNRTTYLIDTSGQKALNWGTVMLFFACLSSLLSFIYITSRIYKQEQLIEALDHSRQQEKKLTVVKDQFLANMSHEIRTPMNAVLGFTHLLQQQPMNASSREYVTAIQHAGENLLDIINDILDISKIESGMMRLEPVSFSLRSVLHSLELMFLPKARQKQLDFSVHADSEVPDILYGDAMRLTQVLVNLTNNAIKFTARGAVQVKAARLSDNGDHLRLAFTVNDTGIGIEPDKLSSIFDRFSQAEADITRKYGGTGLGLTIVRQLVELQNGQVNVSSQPGKGSTFTVILPYTTGELVPDNVANISNQQDHVALTPLPDIRLLVVEDNRMNQHLLRHLLNNRQLHYQLVSNGQEALLALSQAHFDLVLMDIQMPEMDGYTATTKIREELHSKIPVIAMTAHAMTGEREKCLQAGMNEYIAKPIREEELYRLIRFFTGKGNMPEQLIEQYRHHPYTVKPEPPLVNPEYQQQLSGSDKASEQDTPQQLVQQYNDHPSVKPEPPLVNPEYQQLSGSDHASEQDTPQQLVQQYNDHHPIVKPVPSLVKLEYLQQLSRGDKAFEQDMLAQFVTQLPEDLTLLKKAINDGNVKAIRSAAHTLKTTVSFIGLETQLYPPLASLEQLEDNYNANMVTDQFNLLRDVCIKALHEALQLLI
ncbi:hybrid sensor histidine kinase/response regulator [Chitinophaga rhizophila]|uniref:histidine kinase n=1 Tax=Chitinophaga rhizophila TaxID=2866212 RepID=A0ABS7GHS6_9BACT|nr:hybrid sensor histidine kinase/response regulator [Chitinophaga rhizophila]MBW8686866.1 response regulator [Chitinophaga rhizophila]